MIQLDRDNLTIQLAYPSITSNYTIVLRNTITKDIYKYDVKGENNGIYCHFNNIDTYNIIDGEYVLILVANPNNTNFEIIDEYDDVRWGQVMFYLSCGDKLIKMADNYVGISQMPNIMVCARELARKGSIYDSKREYHKDNKYIVYKG